MCAGPESSSPAITCVCHHSARQIRVRRRISGKNAVHERGVAVEIRHTAAASVLAQSYVAAEDAVDEPWVCVVIVVHPATLYHCCVAEEFAVNQPWLSFNPSDS